MINRCAACLAENHVSCKGLPCRCPHEIRDRIDGSGEYDVWMPEPREETDEEIEHRYIQQLEESNAVMAAALRQADADLASQQAALEHYMDLAAARDADAHGRAAQIEARESLLVRRGQEILDLKRVIAALVSQLGGRVELTHADEAGHLMSFSMWRRPPMNSLVLRTQTPALTPQVPTRIALQRSLDDD